MQKESRAFVNGNVITMDENDTRAEGVLVREGRITEVGTSKDIEKAAESEGIPVENLQGRTVLPGFHDCHVHVIGTGMASVGADLYHCSSVQEIIEALKEEENKGGPDDDHCGRSRFARRRWGAPGKPGRGAHRSR